MKPHLTEDKMKLAFILVIIAVTACHGYSAPVSGGDKADAEIQLSKVLFNSLLAICKFRFLLTHAC